MFATLQTIFPDRVHCNKRIRKGRPGQANFDGPSFQGKEHIAGHLFCGEIY